MVVLDIEPETALALADYQKPVWVQFHLGLPGMPTLDAIDELR